MAEKYSTIYTDINNGKLIKSPLGVASLVGIAEAEAVVAAADNDGDIFRLFRVPGNGVPVFYSFKNDAITGGTDFDLGLYDIGIDGAVKDVDVLADGLAFSTASSSGVRNSPHLITNKGKQFWELAGDTEYTGQCYDVCLTANTVGTADGDAWITLFYKYV